MQRTIIQQYCFLARHTRICPSVCVSLAQMVRFTLSKDQYVQIPGLVCAALVEILYSEASLSIVVFTAYSAVVPRRRLPSCKRCRLATAPAVSVDGCTVRPNDAPFNCRRPRVPRGCRADMEQFTARRNIAIIATNAQASPQDKATPEAPLAHDNFISL